jgi:hypothetical protein
MFHKKCRIPIQQKVSQKCFTIMFQEKCFKTMFYKNVSRKNVGSQFNKMFYNNDSRKNVGSQFNKMFEKDVS